MWKIKFKMFFVFCIIVELCLLLYGNIRYEECNYLDICFNGFRFKFYGFFFSWINEGRNCVV